MTLRLDACLRLGVDSHCLGLLVCLPCPTHCTEQAAYQVCLHHLPVLVSKQQLQHKSSTSKDAVMGSAPQIGPDLITASLPAAYCKQLAVTARAVSACIANSAFTVCMR